MSAADGEDLLAPERQLASFDVTALTYLLNGAEVTEQKKSSKAARQALVDERRQMDTAR